MKEIIKISKTSNCNYLAKIIKLKNLRKHKNADRLQIATIDFQDVVTGLEAKNGDLYCYFPVECQINKDFLSFTNSFRHPELNKDKKQKGFFGDNGRVKAVKLRGEKSMGYIVPVEQLEGFTKRSFKDFVGKEFDTVDETLIVNKYRKKIKQKQGNSKQSKKPRISRLVEGQVKLHVSTENLRKNAFKIEPNDYITITYKTHGTSWWAGNLLVKKKLNIFLKLFRFIGLPIKDTEYDYVYGSRNVVKNEYETRHKEHFYKEDLWGEIKDELKEFIPKGFTFYGECLGYTKSGRSIQGEYDYSCEEGQKRIQVYRITFTNADGIAHELSSRQTKELCDKFELEYVYLFYQGKAKDLYDIDVSEHWQRNFVEELVKQYNDKNCFMCKNKVPEEGIVLRKESLYKFEAYKLKSFKFLEMETKNLDKNIPDMEEDN